MENLIKKLHRPVDISSLVFFRIIFGGILLWEVTRYYSKNWIERYWINPDFYFTYPGFDWVVPLEHYKMYTFFFFLGLAAFCYMFGLFYRLASIFIFLGFSYIFLLDKSNYLNHFYLIILVSFSMIFMPAHRAYSLDAKIWPEIRKDKIPFWALGLIMFQIGVAYFYGGIAKLNTDWLQGQPMYLWLGTQPDFPIIGQFFHEKWMVLFMTYAGTLLDLFIVPMLIWRPTRILGYIFIVMFHVMNHFLWSIGIFPWLMIGATLIFFDPDWFRNLVNKIPIDKLNFTKLAKMETYSFPRPNLFVGLAAFFVFIQVIVPFRHWLYPGNVNWNEKGHRFSWHMKLRDKNARARFRVIDLDTNQEWRIRNKDFLSSRQRRKMPNRPDMIVQFAHHLGDKFRSKGHTNLAVYAEVDASLNGRQYQKLIRPDVNLLDVTVFSPSGDFIVPLTEKLQLP